MRYFLFFVLLSLSVVSCKPPLPVYFDKPIGTKVQGFDTSITGNYIPLNDILDKGEKAFSEKYTVKYDKIDLKDNGVTIESNGKNINDEDVKNIIGTSTVNAELGKRNCDSVFHSICSFNELVFSKLGSGIEKSGTAKTVAGIVKITYDRIFFISVDSAGNNSKDTILSLNPSVLLTRFSEKYFLNFKTQYGWEIMQMDIWENKFLSARPFYFTSYDECSKNIVELTSSTKNIYPNLKPILNADKKVIGFKANLDAKALLGKFKKSEESVLLLKIK